MSVAAIIEHNGNLLLLKEFNSGTEHWDIPAGGMEKNESPIDALKREVEEETGLVVDAAEMKLIVHHIEPERLTVNYLFHIVLDTDPGELTAQDDDILEVAFKPREFVEQQLADKLYEHELARVRLEQYINGFPEKLSLEVVSE